MRVKVPDTVRKTDGPTARGRRTDDHNIALYEVRVLDTIKGSLRGNIIVTGRVEPGGEYVFATNVAPNGKWQLTISRDGPIRTESERARLVRAFRRAYEGQIVFVWPPRAPE